MASLIPMMLRLVRADHAELARQVQYLTAENRILRSKINGPVRLTQPERRRLVRLGLAVGPAIKDLISIVGYDTFRRWARGGASRRKSCKPKRPPGRPRTQAALEELVVRLAKENPAWGYSRILGELRKLGYRSICRSSVRNILKRHRIEPAPERDDPTWAEFIKRHAETLWACDFFTTQVLTPRGMRPASVLAFIHIKSRRVIATKATFHPTARWSAEAAECLCEAVREAGLPKPTIVLRDNDKKFGELFDEALDDDGMKAEPIPMLAPLCNAHMERWIQSLRKECLNQFIPVGLTHLDHLVSEYLMHYDRERPHQSKGNLPLIGQGRLNVWGEIVCTTRLAGVLRHYELKAA